MTDDELYESWKRQSAPAEAPAGFADLVLEAIHAYEQRPMRRFARCLLALATSRLGRAGICTVAIVLFAFRLASVLAIFLTGLPEIGE